MDVQQGVVERFGATAGPLLATLARAIGAARRHGIPVIHVQVAFRPGAPEVSARNKAFSTLATGRAFGPDDPGTAIHPLVAPRDGDIVVVKKRVSAFAGSDLALVLRSLDVGSLVLGGIATSGVVLSTLREAADMDYDLVVLRDGCTDADPEVHEILLEKVFPRHASVVDVDEWIGSLDAGNTWPP